MEPRSRPDSRCFSKERCSVVRRSIPDSHENDMNTSTLARWTVTAMLGTGFGLVTSHAPFAGQAPASVAAGGAAQFSDSHFHLTNYIQEGTDVRKYLDIMGSRVVRSTLFGIPLQQTWDYGNSGDFAPTYYLQTDAPLYYYSFTDAFIAMAYRSLSKEEQARFDPMITGFTPADMYAADHITRVLQTFPGVFSG